MSKTNSSKPRKGAKRIFITLPIAIVDRLDAEKERGFTKSQILEHASLDWIYKEDRTREGKTMVLLPISAISQAILDQHPGQYHERLIEAALIGYMQEQHEKEDTK